MDAFLGLAPSSSKGIPKLKKTSTPTEKKSRPTPWVEKYRPKCVDDVAYQDEVVAVLKSTLKGSDLPNMLFYGPPGTGKTSSILALAHEMFGDMYRSRILELNASDERGIQVVREKIKKFSQLSASATRPDGKPCPPLKIVILDEADSMTHHAQAALRRTMEKESKTTRFCLLCNYVSRIIDPLTSRCSKFRFKPLAKEVLIEKLTNIAQLEGIKYQPGTLETLIELSEGDMRKAITTLQSCHKLSEENGISLKVVNDIAGVVPEKWIQEFIESCISDSYSKLELAVANIMNEGFPASTFISQIHDWVIPRTDLNDKQKSVICEKLAICDHRLLDGADEYLQIMDLGTVMMHEMCHGNQ